MVPFFKWCSIQNACKNGWFADKDSEELLSLADEIGSSFCSVRDMNTEANNYLQTISTIMSRFYPRMKMGQILAFLEVKPGYGTFAYDFHILKNAKPSAEDKVRLFVAQTDNIETSSCITTPPQVNFLLNGKGVDKRTNVFMVCACLVLGKLFFVTTLCTMKQSMLKQNNTYSSVYYFLNLEGSCF
ncbi:E4 SUMO-protein ligase PIAL2-like [Camellia sinensis]|uniref:E4 SUMO-protein ligase PIAL2-like n=1 Tax=Camellia sinensis TaxID=4442 RepID=UPI001036CD38|nr:E4 SUMO-protein ligase PIAL2-like [Camellia sinensis]